MKAYGVNELRKMFLEFFESKEHLKMKSFSLVPHNDNSLLLINSGMAPLKPYFTGQEIPPRRRVTTCQKCIRTGDLENVGKTARHGTFFEMLGNFSFGDYFKEEAISWCWEFLTKVVGIPEDRLYPSVYENDDEAFDIWNKKMGIASDRIFRFGKADNFWEHGSGPCGPCSEVYFDRGEKYGCGKPDCKVGCDCDRYMEVWNNVFSQFNNDGNGNYTDLIQKNIDTGMGLERLAVVCQDVDSIFDVDTIRSLRDKVCEFSGKTYKAVEKDDISIRIITDHIRSATFMISDGILPSNNGRGYVLRRIIRRAARNGRLLGIDGTFLAKLAETVIEGSKDGYPELEEKRDFIVKVLNQEEESFNKTIDQGLSILNDMEEALKASGKTELSGDDAFKLYDTFGFPMDLTKEILEEKGYTIDEAGFNKAMDEQKKAAREGRSFSTKMAGADATVYDELDPAISSEFIGYDTLTAEDKILAMTSTDAVVEALADGDEGTIVTAKTPFYATMGGQQGDIGTITCGDSVFTVKDTIKLPGGKIGHVGVMTKGMLKVSDAVSLKVDSDNRMATCKNHSATHLLQKALREVLGSHVEQQGSFQDATRTRFDFSHFQAMTKEEIEKVEAIVNEQILANLPVVTNVMGIEEAKKTGAMALFGEKYGDSVRVVSMGEFSIELCGGTHVKSTGEISVFKILSESGVAAGVRRIEAITASNVYAYYQEIEKAHNEAAAAAKTAPASLVDKINAMTAEIKALKSELESLKSKAAGDALKDVMNDVKDIKGVSLIAAAVPGIDMNGLRDLGDQLKSKLDKGVVLLASEVDGKVCLMATATDAAQKAGAHAGNLIKGVAALVGGGGGGKPAMAQAGGKNPAGIPDALKEAEKVLEGQIQ